MRFVSVQVKLCIMDIATYGDIFGPLGVLIYVTPIIESKLKVKELKKYCNKLAVNKTQVI